MHPLNDETGHRAAMSHPTKDAHETRDQQLTKIVTSVEVMVDVIAVTHDLSEIATCHLDLMMTMTVGQHQTTTVAVINLPDDEDKVHAKDISATTALRVLGTDHAFTSVTFLGNAFVVSVVVNVIPRRTSGSSQPNQTTILIYGHNRLSESSASTT